MVVALYYGKPYFYLVFGSIGGIWYFGFGFLYLHGVFGSFCYYYYHRGHESDWLYRCDSSIFLGNWRFGGNLFGSNACFFKIRIDWFSQWFQDDDPKPRRPFSHDIPKRKPQLYVVARLDGTFWGNVDCESYYWGCNQYITQRALGADLDTARKGLLFAAFLKLLMPVIVTLPGIAAYALYQKGLFQQEMLGVDGTFNQDRAYPVLLNLLPAGLKGLSFAALTAAVVASLAGKANSISTIFTLDVFRPYFAKDMSEKSLVLVGRVVIVIAMILAIVISPFMGIEKKGGFQFIQEMTGLLSPGIFAAFIMGFFWKKTNSAGAFFAIVGGLIIAVLMNFDGDAKTLETLGFNNLFPLNDWSTVPFLDRMGWVFVICVVVMFVLSLILPDEKKGLEIDASMFKPSTGFTIGASIVIVIIVSLYTYFW